MVKKRFNSASLFIILCLAVTMTNGCSKGQDEKSTPAASPTPAVNATSSTSPTPAVNATPSTSPTPAVNATSSTSQLTFKGALFVKKGADGKLIPVENGVFQRGEEITLVLLKTGKFKKGADGKNWLDMDMRVKTPQGKVLSSKQSLLGDKGKVNLKDDMAEPNGTVNTTPKVEPGVYQMTLTVYDKVAGTQVSETKSFTLK